MNGSHYKCPCQPALCQPSIGQGVPTADCNMSSGIAAESMLGSRLKKKYKILTCNEAYRFHAFALRNPQPNEVGSSFALE